MDPLVSDPNSVNYPASATPSPSDPPSVSNSSNDPVCVSDRHADPSSASDASSYPATDPPCASNPSSVGDPASDPSTVPPPDAEPVFQKEFGASGSQEELWDISQRVSSQNQDSDTTDDVIDAVRSLYADWSACQPTGTSLEEKRRWRRVCFLNQRTVDGSTPLFMAVFSGNVEIVEYLLQAGSGSDFECTHGNFFHAAVLSQSMGLVERALGLGCHINHINAFGNSPLILVSRLDMPDMCRLLVENGADMNARDRFRETPLLASVYFGCESNARVLIQHGAALDLVDDK